MPGTIGWPGLVVLILVALLVFGPKRLPEMGRSMGRGLREFKDSVTGGGKDGDGEDFALPPADEAPGAVPRVTRDREQTI